MGAQLAAVRFAYCEAMVAGIVLLCGRLGVAPTLTLAALSAATALAASCLPEVLAPLLGLVAWAFFTGFVTNHYGVLTFDHDDVLRMTVLIGLAAAAHWRRWPDR